MHVRNNRSKLMVLITLLQVCLLSLTFHVYAEETPWSVQHKFKSGAEPDGFRGIKWGTDIESVKKTKNFQQVKSQDNIDVYISPNDSLQFGDASADEIQYKFWNGKFKEVYVEFRSVDNVKKFKATLFNSFGQGTGQKLVGKDGGVYEIYTWNSDETELVFIVTNYVETASYHVSSRKLTTEALNDLKKKKEAGKAPSVKPDASDNKFKSGTEPDGFRGIKWGTDIESVKQLKELTQHPSLNNLDAYEAPHDSLVFGDASASGIEYLFWNGKFAGMRATFECGGDNVKFKKILFDTFGKGKEEKTPDGRSSYLWNGDGTTMLLIDTKISSMDPAVYLMGSTKLFNEADNDLKKKKEAGKGADKGF